MLDLFYVLWSKYIKQDIFKDCCKCKHCEFIPVKNQFFCKKTQKNVEFDGLCRFYKHYKQN